MDPIIKERITKLHLSYCLPKTWSSKSFSQEPSIKPNFVFGFKSEDHSTTSDIVIFSTLKFEVYNKIGASVTGMKVKRVSKIQVTNLSDLGFITAFSICLKKALSHRKNANAPKRWSFPGTRWYLERVKP